MNHVHLRQRMEFINNLMAEEFGIKVRNVGPIEYEADCLFDYNDSIYKFNVGCRAQNLPTQLGTIPLPSGTENLVIRLSNTASGSPDHNRVENEVGMMHLFRTALADQGLEHLVPKVYAWGAAENAQGYILQEFKPGMRLDSVFEAATEQQKQEILTQMANIVTAIQEPKVPGTITQFGGVSFDAQGEVVSGPMTTLGKGPFASQTHLYQALFQQQLSSSDKSPVLNGWQEDGLRTRLDCFCTEELPKLTKAFETEEKKLVHADLSK